MKKKKKIKIEIPEWYDEDDERLDKLTMRQLRDIPGFYEPYEEEWKLKGSNKTRIDEGWVATINKGSYFFCNNQFEAHIIAEIAVLNKKLDKVLREIKFIKKNILKNNDNIRKI